LLLTAFPHITSRINMYQTTIDHKFQVGDRVVAPIFHGMAVTHGVVVDVVLAVRGPPIAAKHAVSHMVELDNGQQFRYEESQLKPA